MRVDFLNEVKVRGILKRKSFAVDSQRPRVNYTVQVPRGRTGLFDFVTCYSLGETAVHVDTIEVGSFVAVEGAIRSSTFTTPAGERLYRTEVTVWKIADYGVWDSTTPPTFHTGGDVR